MSDLCPVYAPFFSAMVSSAFGQRYAGNSVNDDVDRAAPVLSSSRVSSFGELETCWFLNFVVVVV